MSPNNKSRKLMVVKNIIWGYGNTIFTTILKFVSRWAFIHTIGVTYLGINGLYMNILSVLSLTELGISSAMNYSLYKPVSENDTEKIKSIMKVYKKAYRVIAFVVSIIGVMLLPFLQYLIKDAKGLSNNELVFYYLLFLFNTVSSYFVSYKYSLNNAEQKGYITNNINTVTTIITTILQIIALFVFESFTVYLVVQILVQLIGKIFASLYINKLYPYLKDKNVKKLDKETKKSLFVNTKSLMMHKLGQVAVDQTDNIIISSFISVKTVGLISNYTLVTGTVDTFLSIVFNNIVGSLGNLCATTDKEYQYRIYKIYDFVDFWMYGFCAIAYVSLIQPFSALMWGNEYVVDFEVVVLIILNTYIVGQRIPLNNMKTAAGVFKQDQYLPIIQAVLNLGISILLAKKVGLIGVYIGTIVSGIIPTFIRPLLVYKPLFDKNSGEFYLIFFKHLFVVATIGAINYYITSLVMSKLNWITFMFSVIITAILPNIFIILLYFKTDEFKYVKNMIIKVFNKNSIKSKS